MWFGTISKSANIRRDKDSDSFHCAKMTASMPETALTLTLRGVPTYISTIFYGSVVDVFSGSFTLSVTGCCGAIIFSGCSRGFPSSNWKFETAYIVEINRLPICRITTEKEIGIDRVHL